MTTMALAVAFTILIALAILQVLLIAGRPLGSLGWGGRHRVLPTRLRVASGISIVLYGLFALLLLSRAGVLPGADASPVVVGTWLLFAFCAISVVMNGLSRSRPERLVQTPASVVLALAVLVIALSNAA
ncbi:hypothetical protein ACQPZU_14985 [Saccharomonospora azurea]|uniref:Integral membrane protein n=1 Tax=Saccharomonospora azurea NA-128 TaxID=882081 RepID=H8G6C3_9PSEU|nr:hypothetical protein [Saccharomonospora azurea]EHK88788.1 integral membrane protein [Saccharomonospora azurea SZMC 14600]EHY88266.1 hypothetical protein SacazDRAFT_01335 [Saccharomonospora azurea NA-128]